MLLLPQELISEIIFLLQDDKATLNSLSLVNRTIAHECQSHLFSHIVVRGPNKPMHPFGGSATALSNLLQSSPHLAKHVRCLELFDTKRYWKITSPRVDNSIVKRWLPEDKHIARCIPNFTNLEAFIIQFLMNIYEPQPKEVLQGLLDCCKSVRRLPHISFVCISFVPDLSFIEELLNLKHLWICEVFYEPTQTSHTSPNSNPNPIHLQSLCLEQKSSNGIPYHYFLDPSCRFSITTLRKLAINLAYASSPGDKWHYTQISNLLDLCADTLEELELAPSLLTFVPLNGEEKDTLNLGKLTRLRWLKIHLRENDSAYRNFPWLPTLLDSFGPINPNFQELVISLSVRLTANVINIDKALWKAVFDCLLDDRFEGLKALTINLNVQFQETPAEGREIIIDALQALYGVGRLRDRENMDLAINILKGATEWRPDNFPPNHPDWQPTPAIVDLG
ncbi:hypothetical protein CPB83DRAFT_858694, partial [Crepidotus variabilis]